MLLQVKYKSKCDIYNCNNEAIYCYAIKGRARQLNMCRDCLNRLTSENTKVTKSPANAISKQLKFSTVKDESNDN